MVPLLRTQYNRIAVELDTSRWSGDGEFTQSLIDSISLIDRIEILRVEDAPSTRADVEYNFIANEMYVAFTRRARTETTKRFGFLPVHRTVEEKAMTIAELESSLTGLQSIGPPDYADEEMLQYLRTERIIPPYQTRGYKLVELVRIYEVGHDVRASESRG